MSRTKFLKVLNNRMVFNAEKLSPWQTAWLHQICGNIIHSNISTYHRLPHWLSDQLHLVPKCVDTNMMMYSHITYPMTWGLDTVCKPLHPLAKLVVWARNSHPWWCWRVYFSRKLGTLNKTSLDNWYFLRLQLSDGSLTLIYIVSLMFLVKLCDFPPRIENLSTLVRWPSLLACS